MANSQLTAYVTAQLDKGVSRDAITQALIGAGWVQADVEAAVGEVMQQRAGGASVQPVETASAAQPFQAQPLQQPAAAQPISYAATEPAASTVTSPATATVTPASFFATSSSTPIDGSVALAPKRSMAWLFILVGIILALGIIGGVVYAFFLSGSADLPSVTDQNAQGQQLQTLQQERDQLQGQVSGLTASVTDLENQLGIFVPSTSATVPLTIRGNLASTTASSFTLETSRGIVLTVSNGKDASVAAVLAPLVGAEVELTGTHAPGSTLLKVTAVNGSAIPDTAPATGATTTAQ